MTWEGWTKSRTRRRAPCNFLFKVPHNTPCHSITYSNFLIQGEGSMIFFIRIKYNLHLYLQIQTFCLIKMSERGRYDIFNSDKTYFNLYPQISIFCLERMSERGRYDTFYPDKTYFNLYPQIPTFWIYNDVWEGVIWHFLSG